uniref:Uncharacterized protein n=1 Tax=Oryza rufipogon TaxID=4529 RepID=A0A0E0PGU3_ORYRU
MEAMQQRRRGSNAKAIGPSRGHLPRVVTCPRAVPGVEEEDGGVGGRYPGVEEENGGGFPRGSEPELKKKKTEVGFLRSRRLELKKMEVHWACAYVIAKPWEAYQGYAFGEPASGACVVLPV